MQVFYLGLGSNLGNRHELLVAAIHRLTGLPGVQWRLSSLYETEPVDYLDQPWFLNAVLELTFETPRNPHGFLVECLALETEFGRERLIPRGARTLDLDLLLGYQHSVPVICDEMCNGVTLMLPHPRLHQRRFVLEPLCELCPDDYHPTLGKTFRELFTALSDTSVVRCCGKFPV